MRKGGRCSPVAALGSNLLGIKPCIEVKNGKMVVAKKYRGSFERCICQYVKDRLEDRNDLCTDLIFITHPDAPVSAIETAKNEIKKYANFDEIIETKASCTISCHCGPHTLGILFVHQ
jgi:fatty acid-binding protein DegV